MSTNSISSGPLGTEPSQFPSNLLPEPFRAIVEESVTVYGVPPILPAASALGTVSAALGRGLQIESGRGRKAFGNLFIMISAASGSGKSSVLGALLEPMRILEECLELDAPAIGYPEDSSSSGPGCVSAGHRGVKTPSRPKRGGYRQSGRRQRDAESIPRLISDDITGPALASVLSDNDEVTFCASAEAGNILDEVARHGTPLARMLLSGFSGEQIRIHRVARPEIVLKTPVISILWLCQTHRLEDFLRSDRLLEDGLLARFLVAHSEAEMSEIRESRKRMPSTLLGTYEALINHLFEEYHQGSDNGHIVRATPEAERLITEFHNWCAAQSRDALRDLRTCVVRWPEQVWKVAVVLHAMTCGPRAHHVDLPEETASAAIEMVRWFSSRQRDIIQVGSLSADRQVAERLLKLVSEAPGKEMKVRDLTNSHGFDDSKIERAMELQATQLVMEKRQNPKGGRPSRVIRVRE